MNIDGNNHKRGRLLAVVLSLCGLLAVGSADKVLAADWPEDIPLRGSIPVGPMRWDGINFGVHGGWSSMTADLGNSNGPQVAYILRNTTIENEFSPSSWTTLPKVVKNSASYGAFLGYSVQWDALVLGVDLAYNRLSSMDADATDTISRQFNTSDGYNNNVTIIAQSSVNVGRLRDTTRPRRLCVRAIPSLCRARRGGRPI